MHCTENINSLYCLFIADKAIVTVLYVCARYYLKLSASPTSLLKWLEDCLVAPSQRCYVRYEILVFFSAYPIRWRWSPRGIWSPIGRPWRWDCGGRGLLQGSSSSWSPENRWRAALSPCSQSDNDTLTLLSHPICTCGFVCLTVDTLLCSQYKLFLHHKVPL